MSDVSVLGLRLICFDSFVLLKLVHIKYSAVIAFLTEKSFH